MKWSRHFKYSIPGNLKFSEFGGDHQEIESRQSKYYLEKIEWCVTLEKSESSKASARPWC